MITFTEDIVIYWEQKTAIPIGDFLFNFYEFYQESYPLLLAFYSGKSTEISAEHNAKLNNLIKQYEDIETQIISRSGVFTNVLDSEIIEQLSSLQFELLQAKALNKFLRSNIVNPAYSTKYQFNSQLKQQTIEDLVAEVLGDSDYNNSWNDIAEKNDLQEFEYVPSDATNLLVSVQVNTTLAPVNSVIAAISGDSVLGLDVKKELTWKDDDLETLGYAETFEQSVLILLGLSLGDIPEYRTLGRNVYPGSNMKLFAFPAIFRQLNEVLSSDDSIGRFNVSKIQVLDGDISFEVEVFSRLDDIVNKQIVI